MTGRLDYRSFHDVFGVEGKLPYDQYINRDIESKRKSLGGVLFVDRVLTALGVSKVKIYPPREGRALHELYQQILSSKMSTHHKLSALYYLLLDHDDAIGPRMKLTEKFALQTGMPKRYQIFMRGLWHMDRLQFQVALEFLAHPSLLPEFADNIVTVLVRHAEAGDYSLALAYYYAVQPVLKTQEALELLFGAIAHTDVTEGLMFTRKLPNPARKQLFEQLVTFALKGSSSSTGNLDVADRATELVSLPLRNVEEAWLREFLVTGEGRKLKKAKDTMVMRKIVSGDLGLGEGKSLGGPWGMVLQGFRHGTGGHVEQ
ncbi:hypothetical protein CMQ_5432 [Grosmannia clavigera kw1407]|uniref:ELYS-like domain-containing protein n=1 Tax=Grosmannia clavigera (strain kw1407 / UAMH 11150) TaxID=655863 RepID=F0XG24_GROCL|nr:uncharacterized protein CMQ_5432 [Grosmannia clavigera kw1407]EFX03382.1 hypothetical protein CMQ_5432 [Grosmannia clavigera kw1407]